MLPSICSISSVKINLSEEICSLAPISFVLTKEFVYLVLSALRNSISLERSVLKLTDNDEISDERYFISSLFDEISDER